MLKTNPQVDGYLRKHVRWQDLLEKLRQIILSCGLTEEVKWRVPCYTLDDRNIVILVAFKDSARVTFVKGSLLKDPRGILVKPGEDTQAARMMNFTTVQEVAENKAALKTFIDEAIEVEKSGVKVPMKKITERKVPDELQHAFDETPALEKAFRGLTPGRQRQYLIHFSAAKQSKTRTSRIERCTPQILDGKGLDD